jgi:hypothetical protein
MLKKEETSSKQQQTVDSVAAVNTPTTRTSSTPAAVMTADASKSDSKSSTIQSAGVSATSASTSTTNSNNNNNSEKKKTSPKKAAAKALEADEDDDAVLPWDFKDNLYSHAEDLSDEKFVLSGSLLGSIDRATSGPELATIWQNLQRDRVPGQTLTPYLANKIMSAALKLELPELATDVFEDSFGFYYDPDPAKALLKMLDDDEEEDSKQKVKWTPSPPLKRRDGKLYLEPNNFVCTTAIKAYGRKMQSDRALAVLPWLEARGIVVRE